MVNRNKQKIAMSYSQKIIDLFPKVINSFKENELAYLSLTSKPERPIQDRYALLLNKEFEDKIIIKEYKRRDLVVFHNSDKLATNPNKEVDHVFEFKAGSASSFSKKIRGGGYYHVANDFVERVAKDIANRKRDGTPNADTIELNVEEITGIFIGVEVLNEIPPKFAPIFKYSSRHNRHLSHDEIPDLGKRMIKRFSTYPEKDSVKTFNKPHHQVEEVGLFEGIRVKVHLVVVQGNPEFDFESISD